MKNLQKIRQVKDINQLTLSMKIGVSQETVSAYEMGKSYPSVSTLLKLCDVLDVSADFLLDKTDISYPVSKLLIENISAEELEILSMYRKLTLKKRERVAGFLYGMLSDS